MVDKKGNQVASSEIWDFLKENIEGESYGADEYHISDHILYRNTITKILEDKFGAEPKHTNKGNKVIFNLEKLRRIQKSYDVEIKIKTRLKGEGSEGSEGCMGGISASEDTKTIEDLDNGNGKDKDISINGESEGYPIPPNPPQVPSQPSHPSPPQEVSITTTNECQEPSSLLPSRKPVNNIEDVYREDTFHSRWGYGAIYRFGNSDTHGCNHCKKRGDIFYMNQHECRGKG